jgi:hypothetical protein
MQQIIFLDLHRLAILLLPPQAAAAAARTRSGLNDSEGMEMKTSAACTAILTVVLFVPTIVDE